MQSGWTGCWTVSKPSWNGLFLYGSHRHPTLPHIWAFRWRKSGDAGSIIPIEHPHLVDLDELVGVDQAKEELVRNTAQFVAGHAANNVLLWGERGNGKSSSVKGSSQTVRSHADCAWLRCSGGIC